MLLALAACDNASECGPFADRFRTTDFATQTYRVVVEGPLHGPTFVPVEGDTLRHDALGISMRPVQELYFSERSGVRSAGFVAAAYACDPGIPRSDEVVRDIRITSGTGYASAYPAGTDLAGAFDVLVRSFADRYFYERFSLSDYLARSPNTVDEIVLVPSVPPDTTATHSFTVEYVQEGEGIGEFEFTTEAVTLRPD